MIYKTCSGSILQTILDNSNNINTSDVRDWDFEKRDGMLYFVARAVSVGTNGNGDHFTEDELRKAYKTFVGKGLFVNHASNDIEKKRGMIVDAKWVDNGPNEKYVNCLCELNADAFPEIAKMIRSKMMTDVSMGAMYDIGIPQYITMEDLSLKNFLDIQMGDKVITHDGTIGEVVMRGKEWHQNKTAYKIKAMKTNPVVISEEHPLLIIRNKNKNKLNMEEFVPASKIQKGDYLLSNIYNKIDKNNISINDAKILGWYLAEGSFCDKTGIVFTLNIEDPIDDIVDLIKSIDSNATIHKNKHSASNKAISLVFYSKKIKNLIKNNIFGKTKNKSVSNTVLSMEPEKQLALIGSYIDGDGCIARKTALSVATASENLSRQIPFMLERCGILASVNSVNRKPGKNSVAKKDFMQHTIFIGSTFAGKLKHSSIKANKLSKGKMNCKRSFVYGNYVATPITNIEKIPYSGWAYNIQINSDENVKYKGNHSYHINGIASHNCNVQYSVCSCCGNKAKTTKEYCTCVKLHKGGAFLGKPVYEINHQVEFIELSLVSVGADPQAKILEVLARKKGLDYEELLHKAASSNDPFFIENIESEMVSLEKIAYNAIKKANELKKEGKI